jgi:asparagine synthase (glutamine-hydrolysing)
MSGGLDCRMTNWVANDMGFDNTVNLTYSQYGYLDMELSSAMSSYLKNEWIFSSLDNANYLREIDSITKVVNAQTAYSVSSQSFNFLKNVNFKRFGLMHSGQLGDVVIGTYSVEHAYDKPKSVKALSSKLLSKVQNDFSIYKNEETANFYLRGLNGILTDNFGYQKYTEITSPFLDVDFFNFCMAIPVKFRAYHGLYKEWIVQKYPDAATFKWEGINAKITDRSVRIRKKSVPVKGLLNFIIEGITYNLGLYSKMNTKKGMNPFDYWYRNDIRLRTHFEEYYKNHIDMITDKELKEDCSYLFKKGNTREKMQVLTILSAIKQFEV